MEMDGAGAPPSQSINHKHTHTHTHTHTGQGTRGGAAGHGRPGQEKVPREGKAELDAQKSPGCGPSHGTHATTPFLSPPRQVSQFRNDLSTLRRSFDTAKARAEKRMLLQPGGSGGTKVNSHTERLMRCVGSACDAPPPLPPCFVNSRVLHMHFPTGRRSSCTARGGW